MPLLVAALMCLCLCLCPTGYKVWGRRQGGGEGDLETPAPLLVISHQGMEFGCLKIVMRSHWSWDFLGGGFLLIFSLFGDS